MKKKNILEQPIYQYTIQGNLVQQYFRMSEIEKEFNANIFDILDMLTYLNTETPVWGFLWFSYLYTPPIRSAKLF